MARFIYNGEQARPGLVAQYGPTYKLAVPTKSGETIVLEKADGFSPGQEVDYDFTDQMSLLILRNDPRFSEVL